MYSQSRRSDDRLYLKTACDLLQVAKKARFFLLNPAFIWNAFPLPNFIRSTRRFYAITLEVLVYSWRRDQLKWIISSRLLDSLPRLTSHKWKESPNVKARPSASFVDDWEISEYFRGLSVKYAKIPWGILGLIGKWIKKTCLMLCLTSCFIALFRSTYV